jgi:hypothetical protein
MIINFNVSQEIARAIVKRNREKKKTIIVKDGIQIGKVLSLQSRQPVSEVKRSVDEIVANPRYEEYEYTGEKFFTVEARLIDSHGLDLEQNIKKLTVGFELKPEHDEAKELT